MPMSEPGTTREARSGRVHNDGKEEEESGEGMVNTRHSQSKKRKKGDVGVENEKGKEEGEKMESFFCEVHEFLTDFGSFNVTNSFSSCLRRRLCLYLHLYPRLCLYLCYPLVLPHGVVLRPMTSPRPPLAILGPRHNS